MRVERPFLFCVRSTSALGLVALSWTAELSSIFLTVGWLAWLAGFLLDTRPAIQERVRKLETPSVAVMIAVFLVDMTVRRVGFFVSLADFLILFQALKCLGPKHRGDALQILCFSFFQILAACTLSLNLYQAFVFILLIPIGTMALFWHQVELQKENTQTPIPARAKRAFVRLGWGMAVGSFPINIALTVAIFVLFPRLNWNARLSLFEQNRMGYTEQVNLGRTGSFAGGNAIALYFQVPKDSPSASWGAKIRGVTLDHFDGHNWSPVARTWRNVARGVGGEYQVVAPAQRKESLLLHQTLTLLHPNATTLFSGGNPVTLRVSLSSVQVDDSGSLRWLDRWERPLRYEVVSELNAGEPRGGAILPDDLALPPMNLRAVQELAKQVARAGSPLDRAARVQSYLQRTMRYSTTVEGNGVENPIETFLFKTRSGPCGHFASAMAVLLRCQKIPTRLVAGYRLSEFNDAGALYAVRDRDAHAWVEVYDAKKGWVAFDPTPLLPVPSSRWSRGTHAVSQYWELLEFQWNRLVVEYDLHSQVQGMLQLHDSAAGWGNKWIRWRDAFNVRSLKQASPKAWFSNQIGGISGTGAVLASIWWWIVRRRFKMQPQTPVLVRYEKFLKRMAGMGFPKAESETGMEFAQRVEQTAPKISGLAREETARYYENRFAMKGIPS